MIVTSLKDGMNLVSKEYAACQVDKNGVLILSEFAGSASQLHRGAILVHPYDIENVADAINQALTMPALERRKRMESLQRTIKHYDIFWWMDLYLNTAYALNDPAEGIHHRG
jgi:trehalose 6-phosphate synthase